MIGIDSNVLIRFLTNDEPTQAERARELMASRTSDEPGHVSLVALVETWWVLKHHYRIARERLLDVVQGLLDTPSLVFQCSDEIRRAIQSSRSLGIDLPDVLLVHLDASLDCEATVTFDRRAARIPGIRLVQ